MRPLRLLTVRMLVSHLAVATLSSAIAGLIVTAIVVGRTQSYSIDYYRYLARLTIAQWQFHDPDGQPNAPGLPPGFGIVVSPDDVVLLGYGDTSCRAGVHLAECAPDLLGLPPGARFVMVDGQPWGEVIQPTVTGQRSIVRYGSFSAGPTLAVGELAISGPIPFLLFVTGSMMVIALPLALAIAWFWARPLTQRISQIAAISQQFAAGDFAARVHDHRQDEVGMLAQHFDDMADTLALDVGVLRDLAEQNAELAQQVEQSAIQAERLRLSRDLHDDIAQDLFGLTIRAATLPEQIDRDPAGSKEQARALAAQAEQTLLSLRTILIELRPSALLARPFPEALQALCTDWQATEHIEMEYSAVLSGRRLPSVVEDVVYRTVQEAVHNVAKHAQATSAAVSLVEGQRQITVSITDDGQGFDPTQIARAGHLGIVSMRERAHALGGSFVIESDAARGTTVRLTLPIAREEP